MVYDFDDDQNKTKEFEFKAIVLEEFLGIECNIQKVLRKEEAAKKERIYS